MSDTARAAGRKTFVFNEEKQITPTHGSDAHRRNKQNASHIERDHSNVAHLPKHKRLTAEDSYRQAVENCKRRDLMRSYNDIKNLSREQKLAYFNKYKGFWGRDRTKKLKDELRKLHEELQRNDSR